MTVNVWHEVGGGGVLDWRDECSVNMGIIRGDRRKTGETSMPV